MPYRLVKLRNGKYQVHSTIYHNFEIYSVRAETRWLWIAKRELKKLRDKEWAEMVETQGREIVQIIED